MSSEDVDLRDEADDPGSEKILGLVRKPAEIHPEPGPAPVLGTRVFTEDLTPLPTQITNHYYSCRGHGDNILFLGLKTFLTEVEFPS